MNARIQSRETNSQSEFLRHANFEPVFDENGAIVDIRELKIPTDRRAGIAAMRELFDTHEKGDETLGADGWTGKQRRILSSPAPLAAHYLRHSQKWDARAGVMRDAAMIQLPLEVVWALFELVFEGQYSLEVKEIHQEDEEIVPLGTDHRGEKADDAPGRRFYSRATVAIRIHLPGAQPRDYHGVGVSYGQIRTDKTGNIYAINSERRTVDKGAISDAKREALANMGRVFRRAFEDGDEMVEHVERLLLDRIQAMNKPAIHQRASRAEPIPAPVRKAPTAEEAPAEPKAADKRADQVKVAPKAEPKSSDEEKPKAQTKAPTKAKPESKKVKDVTVSIPSGPDRTAPVVGFTEAFLDILFETCETAEEADALLKANAENLAKLVKDRSDIDAAVAELRGTPDDEIPDFDTPTPAAPATQQEEPSEGKIDETPIDVAGKSGKAVLAELVELLTACKSTVEIEAAIACNKAALRKLTPKQMTQLIDHRQERNQALQG